MYPNFLVVNETKTSEIWMETLEWNVFGLCIDFITLVISVLGLFNVVQECTIAFIRERKGLGGVRREFKVFYWLILIDSSATALIYFLNFMFLKGWTTIMNPLFLLAMNPENYILQCILPFFNYFGNNQANVETDMNFFQAYFLAWFFLDNILFFVHHLIICIVTSSEEVMKPLVKSQLIYTLFVTVFRSIVMFIVMESGSIIHQFTDCKSNYTDFLLISSDMSPTEFSYFQYQGSISILMRFSSPYSIFFWFLDAFYRFTLFIYLFLTKSSLEVLSISENPQKDLTRTWKGVKNTFDKKLKIMKAKLRTKQDQKYFHQEVAKTKMSTDITKQLNFEVEKEKMKFKWRPFIQMYCFLTFVEVLVLCASFNTVVFYDCFSHRFFNLSLIDPSKRNSFFSDWKFYLLLSLIIEAFRTLIYETIHSSLSLNAFFKSQLLMNQRTPEIAEENLEKNQEKSEEEPQMTKE